MWGEPSHPSPNSVVFVILLLLKPEPFFPAVGSSFELIFNTGAGSDFQGVSFLWMVFFSPFPPKRKRNAIFSPCLLLSVCCVLKTHLSGWLRIVFTLLPVGILWPAASKCHWRSSRNNFQGCMLQQWCMSREGYVWCTSWMDGEGK